MRAMYVQAMWRAWTKGFLVYLFSTQQKFSLKYCSSDEEVREIMSYQWLERLIITIVSTTVESNPSRADLESLETLRHECDNMSSYEAWQFCGVSTSSVPIGHVLWNFGKKNTCHSLKYYNLWKSIFNQNAIKNHLQASLKLDISIALMPVSLCRVKVEHMDWG